MQKFKTTLERAFELARSGTLDTPTAIAKAVGREGYEQRQLDGPSLRRQLKSLIQVARATDVTSPLSAGAAAVFPATRSVTRC